MSNLFLVSNKLGNIELDCDILDNILENNSINSDVISQSNDNESNWLVQISENQKEILEKKDYHLRGLHNNVEYCLFFSSLDKDQPGLSARSQQESSSQQCYSFKNINELDSTVVSEVCQRSHEIMDTEFQVMPYYKNPINDGNYGDYLLNSSLKFELMEKYHRTVETMLQPHVKPIWSKSNGQVLKIEYSKDISQEEALKKVENLLQNVHEETIKLSAEMLEKAKQFIEKETRNAIVSLDPSDQTLKIAAFGQDTLRQYKESFISGGILTSKKNEMISMDSPKKSEESWQNVQRKNLDSCNLDEKTLTGVAGDDMEGKIKTGFESNVMTEKLLPLEEMQVDYIKKKKMNDINEFCHKFGTENPVTMTIRLDNQLCITASGENIDKASEFIGEILKGFKDFKHMMEYHGIKNDEKKEKSASRKGLLTIYQMKYANVTIIIYQGDITQLSVDAIVNAANKEMDHGGGVAKAIINAGGSKIQDESRTKLASLNLKSIAVGDAIITSGGDLPCKHVIHAVGPIWKGGSNNEALLLSKAIQKSLEIADVYTLASIAFPAISTGRYAYPLAQAVNVMISAVKEYLDKNFRTTLTTISFVDTRSVVTAEFHRQIDQGFFPKSANEKKAPSSPLAPSEPMLERSQSDMPTVESSVIIMKGKLEKIKADIIVNSISNELDFSKGHLASAILQSAGKEIEMECKKFIDLDVSQIIITEGYRLPCKKVFHISLPMDPLDIKEIIRDYMERCLKAADNHKALSIAFPSLGTGQLKYPPEVVANVMLRVAYYHLNKPSTSLKKIFMIIYPKDNHILKAFRSASNDLIEVPNIEISFEVSMIEAGIQMCKNSLSGIFFGTTTTKEDEKKKPKKKT